MTTIVKFSELKIKIMLQIINLMLISLMISLCIVQTESSSEPVSARWSVSSPGIRDNSSHHCLLLSANLSIILVHPGEDVRNMTEDVRRLHWKIEVPNEAEARGVCGDMEAEISLHWEDGEEENVVNLVVAKNGRLADLTGVFARFYLHSRYMIKLVTDNFVVFDLRRVLGCTK